MIKRFFLFFTSVIIAFFIFCSGNIDVSIKVGDFIWFGTISTLIIALGIFFIFLIILRNLIQYIENRLSALTGWRKNRKKYYADAALVKFAKTVLYGKPNISLLEKNNNYYNDDLSYNLIKLFYYCDLIKSYDVNENGINADTLVKSHDELTDVLSKMNDQIKESSDLRDIVRMLNLVEIIDHEKDFLQAKQLLLKAYKDENNGWISSIRKDGLKETLSKTVYRSVFKQWIETKLLNVYLQLEMYDEALNLMPVLDMNEKNKNQKWASILREKALKINDEPQTENTNDRPSLQIQNSSKDVSEKSSNFIEPTIIRKIALLEEAYKKNPSDHEIVFSLATAYKNNEELNKAISVIETSWKFVSSLELGSLYYSCLPDDAKTKLKRVQKYLVYYNPYDVWSCLFVAYAAIEAFDLIEAEKQCVNLKKCKSFISNILQARVECVKSNSTEAAKYIDKIFGMDHIFKQANNLQTLSSDLNESIAIENASIVDKDDSWKD